MSSPTSLVPASIISKHRKNSRHAFDELIARGPSLRGSTSPEVVRKALQEVNHSGEEVQNIQNGKGKQPVYETEEVEFVAPLEKGLAVRRMSVVSVAIKEESDDEGQDLCVICLQAVRDPTIVGECGHQIFCFECINVWANQSRKCPLCTRPMAPFLLHELDSPVGPSKFYLPPIPTIHPTPVTSSLPALTSNRFRRPRPSAELGYSNRDGLVGRTTDLWARVKRDSRGVGEEDLLERAVERRREVYRFGLYAKHIASNSFTRFKPCPTPCQFAENKETIAVRPVSRLNRLNMELTEFDEQRATSFIRRELRVWRHLDVEFLTTYIVSLMKSIDIRSEPAVRLLADFLDERGSTGRERRGAEQFAHEVYSFLRSPYRDLALYDAIVQYDSVPVQYSDSESDSEEERVPVRRTSNTRNGDVEQRKDVPIEARATTSRRHRSKSVSDDSASIRSISPPPERRKRARLSPRRWNRADSYVVPVATRGTDHRQWNRRDSWVNPEIRDEVKLKVVEKRPSRAKPEAVLIPERPVEHRGMRGWGESVPEEEAIDVDNDVPPPVDQETVERIAAVQEEPAKPSLELRIFGVAGRAAVADSGRPASRVGYDTDDEDRALEDAIWAETPASAGIRDAEREVDVEATDRNQPARPTVNASREKLLARLEKEKMQAISEQPSTQNEAPPARNQGVPQANPEISSTEAEAKVRARLQIKLRLEREKAAAQAKAKQDATNAADGTADRAAVLRAKLLEKKMAASYTA